MDYAWVVDWPNVIFRLKTHAYAKNRPPGFIMKKMAMDTSPWIIVPVKPPCIEDFQMPAMFDHQRVNPLLSDYYCSY